MNPQPNYSGGEENARHTYGRAKAIVGVSWLIISALGAALIIRHWSAHDQSTLGWQSALVFIVSMALACWIGLRIYMRQTDVAVPQVGRQPLNAYGPALKTAVIVQGIILLLAALMLDLGQCLHVAMVAALADWFMIGLILLRRPRCPTQLDLIAIKWGYLALLAIVGSLGPLVWKDFNW